jgi:hypothetical protein
MHGFLLLWIPLQRQWTLVRGYTPLLVDLYNVAQEN